MFLRREKLVAHKKMKLGSCEQGLHNFKVLTQNFHEDLR